MSYANEVTALMVAIGALMSSTAPVAADAEYMLPTVSVRADFYQSTKIYDDASGFLGTTVQAKSLPSFGEHIDGKIEGRITNSALNRDGVTRSTLLEGYVTYHADKIDVRVGKQVVAWGRADGINPTDNLTPRNYTIQLPFEEDQRFGTLAFKTNVYLTNEITTTIFATPYFEPSKVAMSAALPIIEKRPRHGFADSEYAIKLNKTGDDLDWSLSYFRGFSLLPTGTLIKLDLNASALETHYDRIRVYGADFARNFQRIGMRGEIAYIQTDDKDGSNQNIMNPSLYYVFGLDRQLTGNLTLNVQFFQRRVTDFHDPSAIDDPLLRIVAIQNAIANYQQDRISQGYTFRISDKWANETLMAEILAVVNTTRHDAYIRPQFRYTASDHFEITLGGDYYSGADHTPFGRLRRNRGAYIELRYNV